MARSRIAWIALTTALLITGACSSDPSAAPSSLTAPTGTSVPTGAPVEFSQHLGDWVLPGRDYDNSRATTDSSINAGNVSQLDVAWTAPLAGSLSTVPLIVGDTIYVQDGAGEIAALNRANGKERWKTEAYGSMIGPSGVAVANGRVFAVHGTTGVVAVNADDGKELWVRKLTRTPTEGIDIQPTVIGDLVLVSTVPIGTGIYTGGDRGVIHALDVATGDVRWKFDTVKSANLWGNPAVNSGGGAWYPPAIDTERGAVYWGIANPAPFPGTPEFPNGSSRPGPNLYSDSAVNLDVKNGKLRWYHQVHPHDLFDRDLVHTMIAHDGDDDIVIATGKGAVVVGLDPEKGTALWRTKVGVHKNDELPSLTGPTEVAPGTFGGVLTPPATADGVVYVATVNAPVTLKPNETAYFGAEFGQQDGEIVAIDATTGAIVWHTTVPGDPLGATAVVNDLVFTALFDGQLVALERTTGKIVWTTKTAGPINGWMAVAGNELIVPVGGANPAAVVAYRLP